MTKNKMNNKTRKKINLYSIGNDGTFNHYLFDKKQFVIESLSAILYKISKINLLEAYLLDKKKINIEKYVDVHESDSGKGLAIDIFYGNKKMYFTIICSQKLRLKFNEELFKIAKMPKSIKINKKKFNSLKIKTRKK